MMPEMPELKKAFRDREMNKIYRERQASSNAESEHFREMIQNQRDRLNHVNNQKIDNNDDSSRDLLSDDCRTDSALNNTTSINTTITGGGGYGGGNSGVGGVGNDSSNIRKSSNTMSAELENVFRQIAKKNNTKQY